MYACVYLIDVKVPFVRILNLKMVVKIAIGLFCNSSFIVVVKDILYTSYTHSYIHTHSLISILSSMYTVNIDIHTEKYPSF